MPRPTAARPRPGASPPPAQELRFLRFVAEHGPITVGRVAEELGGELGLARSTVLTVMERLRRKGHLTRRRKDGVFVYASTVPHDRLMQATVGQFVERALGGSVLPFAAWLSEQAEVTPEELAELKHMVAKLRSRKEEP
jgi:predicted transcriptional regulator